MTVSIDYGCLQTDHHSSNSRLVRWAPFDGIQGDMNDQFVAKYPSGDERGRDEVGLFYCEVKCLGMYTQTHKIVSEIVARSTRSLSLIVRCTECKAIPSLPKGAARIK